MSAAKCRVILKPADLTPDRCALLAEKLQSAATWQNQLAQKSPHVLQFVGDLEESERHFSIAHEPADATPDLAALFDSSVPAIDDTKKLLRYAAALFDTLKAAHAGSNTAFRSHGALCPGVLLLSPDGIEKITDFGFAPAFCSVLGIEPYLNLALGSSRNLVAAYNASGVWEVLPVDEYEREDRICAFVDPEKYGLAAYEGFEPGSDIIAAGFLLHLMAEHRHPYLLDPESHRLVELSELMSMSRYNGARRKDFRESTDPGVVAWCNLVEKTLSRIPTNRPTAVQLTELLADHVKPCDSGDLLRRKVDAAESLVAQEAWPKIRAALAGIPDFEETPADVREKALGLLRIADGHMLLEQADGLMAGDQWEQAAGPIEKVLALSGLPGPVAERARKASAALELNAQVQHAIDSLQESGQKAASDQPDSAAAALQEAIAQVEAHAAGAEILPLVKDAAERAVDEAGVRLEALRQEIARSDAERREEAERLEREREALRQQAERWCAQLESALAKESWDKLADLLAGKPDLASWPEPVETRAQEIEAALAAHVSEQERVAAENADRESAMAWITPLESATEGQQWEEVARLLAEKPALRFFPKDLEAKAEAAQKRLDGYRQREADRQAAEQYIAQLRKLVDEEDWVAAADLLGARPALEFLPDAVLEEESRLKKQIQDHLEAIELQKRQIAAWFEAAESSRDAEKWADAIGLLATPPLDQSRMPAEVRDRAAKLLKQCQKALAEQRKRELGTKTLAIQKATSAFLRGCIEKSLPKLVRPEALALNIVETVFDDPDAPGAGRISVDVGLPGSVDGATEQPISLTIPFEFAADTPKLLDEAVPRDLLVQGITQAIADRQVATMDVVIGGLKKGVFPKAELEAQFKPPCSDVDATLHLMGSESENGTVQAALHWDTKGMRWGFDDAESVAGGVLNEAARSIQAALPQRLFALVPQLKAYESRVSFEALPGELGEAAELPEVLPLRARMAIKDDDGSIGSPIATVAFPLRTAGAIPEDFDTRPFLVALNKKVVAAQSSAQEETLSELKKRASEADPKAKAWATPAKITEPTGKITFELGRKKRKPLASLSSTWQADDFHYVLDEPYDAAMSKLKDAARSGPKKPGMALVGVLVLVLAAGGYFGSMMVGGRGAEAPGAISKNEKVPVTPPGPIQPSGKTDTASAESAAKRILRDGCALTDKPGDLNLVSSGIEEKDGEETAWLTFIVPGLAEPTMRFPLDLEGTNWILPEPAKGELKEAVGRLCALSSIEDESLLSVRDGELGKIDWGDLSWSLDVENLSYQFDAQQQASWVKDEDDLGWTTRFVPGLFRVGRQGTKLVDFPTSWRIEGGELVRSESDQGSGADLKTRIVARLQDLQARSADELHGQLVGWVGDAVVGELPDLTLLQPRLDLDVAADGLLPRTFRATWNPATLQFEPDQDTEPTWETRARFVDIASSALALANSEASWLDDAVKPLVEAKLPEPGSDWRLMVAAPWSKQGLDLVDVRTVIEKERLELAIPLEGLKFTDGPTLATLLNESKPKYWATVQAYALVKDDLFTRLEPFATSLAAALGLRPGDLPHCVVAMALHGLPELTYDPASGLIQEVVLSLDARWSVADAPDGLLLAKLRAGVEASQAEAPVILTLGIGNDNKLTVEWDDVSVLQGALPEMKDLETVLTDFSDRMKLETDLQVRLGGSSSTELTSPATVELLTRIWQAKKVDAVKQGTLLKPGQDLASVFQLLADEEELYGKFEVLPTLFAEYFCGPRECFAVACGLVQQQAGKRGVASRLFRLCPTSSLAEANTAPLGDALLGAVLKGLEEVLNPGSWQGHDRLSYQFGLVLGIDAAMGRLPLDSLSFSVVTTKLRQIKNAMSIRDVSISSLGQLGTDLKELRCDYILVDSLPELNPWSPDAEDAPAWARRLVLEAMSDQ